MKGKVKVLTFASLIILLVLPSISFINRSKGYTLTFADFDALFVQSSECFIVIGDSSVKKEEIGLYPAGTIDTMAAVLLVRAPRDWKTFPIYSNGTVLHVILDTNDFFINQIEPFGFTSWVPTNSSVISVGGPLVSTMTNYYMRENGDPSAPVKIEVDQQSGTVVFRSKSGVSTSIGFNEINSSHDMFVIQVFEDSNGRSILIAAGAGGYGTYAAGWFFKNVVYNNPSFSGDSYLVVEWTDLNLDHEPNHWDYWRIVFSETGGSSFILGQ